MTDMTYSAPIDFGSDSRRIGLFKSSKDAGQTRPHSWNISAAKWQLRATPEHAFALAAAVYLALCLASYWFVRPSTLFYFTDYWEHRAIVAEVVRHGTALTDPIYAEDASSRQFTPWSLALGYLVRISGLGIDDAMAIGALAVSCLFVGGSYAFARAYYRHRWAPALFFAVLTCAWGVPPLIWTGFHPLRSQLHGNYYPASVVFGMTLLAWAVAVRLLRRERIGRVGVCQAFSLIALTALGLIIHPLNAGFLLGGAAALAVLEQGVALRQRLLVLGLLTMGMLASTAWPYFNPLALAGPGVARGQDTFNNFDFFFRPMFVIALLGPALFALLAAPAQLLNPRTRVPVVAFIGVFAAYVAGGIANVSVAHRLLDYVALSLQLMLTWLVIGAIDGQLPAPLIRIASSRWKLVKCLAAILVITQVALAAQQLFQPWALNGVAYPAHRVNAEMTRVSAALSPAARVLGWNSAALALPAYDIAVVAFPRPMPLSPTDSSRQADVKLFFSDQASNCERRAIAARWGATHVAWLDEEIGDRLRRQLAALGTITTPAGSWRIVRAPLFCKR